MMLQTSGRLVAIYYTFPFDRGNMDPHARDHHQDPYLHFGHNKDPHTPKPHGDDSNTGTEYDYDVPENYVHLNELAAPSPVQNPSEEQIYRHMSLEETISRDQEYIRKQHQEEANGTEEAVKQPKAHDPSWWTALCSCFSKS